MSERSECSWSETDGVWKTECGRMFEFNDGTPASNHCRFCMYCGKRLKAQQGGKG